MTKVRKFFPEVRLKAMANDPNGRRCTDLVERALENVELVRDDCLGGVDDQIQRIHDLVQNLDAASLRQVHALANDIFALAGAFGLDELSQAAYSLCALLDNCTGVTPAAAIRVHVEAMRALRRQEIASNRHLRAATLTELRTLVERLTSAAPQR